MGDKSSQKRKYIIEKAREVFHTNGYKTVTMKDIVQACEIRKLTDAAFPKWRDDETKFHETVVLSQFT